MKPNTLATAFLLAGTFTLIPLTTVYAEPQQRTLDIVDEVCKYCHGSEGQGSNAIYPRLAGQHKNYIVKQLTDFREKRRLGTMTEMAEKLTDTEIDGLADYFSAKPALTHKVRNKDLAAVGKYIFSKGNPYNDLPACATCHGEDGSGTEDLPRLAGQHKRYVSSQLAEFNDRKRTNDNAIMHSIASKLTELEREAVALYVSGLGKQTQK